MTNLDPEVIQERREEVMERRLARMHQKEISEQSLYAKRDMGVISRWRKQGPVPISEENLAAKKRLKAPITDKQLSFISSLARNLSKKEASNLIDKMLNKKKTKKKGYTPAEKRGRIVPYGQKNQGTTRY